MMPASVNPIERGVLFKFVEDIEGKTFINKTNTGIIIKDKYNDMQHPRWGLVIAIGPKVTKFSIGDYILIENLQWTTALKYNSETFWKTNEDKVILISHEKPIGIV